MINFSTMQKILFITVSAFVLTGFFNESKSQLYTGGSIGYHFTSNSQYFDASPLIGYRYGRLDFGTAPFYSYRDYDNRSSRYSYGNRLFMQLTFIPNVFAHAEFEVTNIDASDGRKWITGLPVGGGYRYNLTDRTRAYGMVLYDVLLHEESTVQNPIVRGGITYSF